MRKTGKVVLPNLNAPARTSTDKKIGALNILADAVLILEEQQPQEKQNNIDALLTLADVTDIEKEINESAKYSSQNVHYIASLRLEIKSQDKELTVDNITKDKQKLKFFTGSKDVILFQICFDYVTDHQLYGNDRAEFSLQQQFRIVLMPLRLGLTEQHLAYVYCASLTTISRIFSKWIPVIYRRFRLLNIWPSEEKILNTMPCSIARKVPDFKGEQLDPFEVAKSRKIANTRIHVERAIGRVKEYKITDEINTTHILPYFNEIFFICCMSANFQDVLIT
eukprot:gene12557-13843_t